MLGSTSTKVDSHNFDKVYGEDHLSFLTAITFSGFSYTKFYLLFAIILQEFVNIYNRSYIALLQLSDDEYKNSVKYFYFIHFR